MTPEQRAAWISIGGSVIASTIGILTMHFLFKAPSWASWGFGYWVYISSERHSRIARVLKTMAALHATWVKIISVAVR